MDIILWQLLLQLLLVVLCAMFTAAETAVRAVSDSRMEQLASDGDRRAKKLRKLCDQPEDFLAAMRVCGTIFGLFGSAFAAAHFSGRLVKWVLSYYPDLSETLLGCLSVIVITFVLAYLTILFGQRVPKRLALKKPENTALSLALPVYGLSCLFLPFIRFLTFSANVVLRVFGIDPNDDAGDVSRESISMMVDAGSEKGVIASEEKEIIQNLFEFDDLSVGEFATHRKDMSLLWMDETQEEWEKTMEETRHSRYPVCDETTDNIVGVLHVKDYYFLADKSRENVMKNVIRAAHFVPETVRADVLFRQMKETRTHFAVVLDEYGGTFGIVTMNDLLEQLVGDLDDDHTQETIKEIEEIEPGTWRIIGTAPLSDVAETLGVELPLDEYEIFSGYVFGAYGSIPDDGAQFVIDIENLHVCVHEIAEHRLEIAYVTVMENEDEDGDDEDDAKSDRAEKEDRKSDRKNERKFEKKTDRRAE